MTPRTARWLIAFLAAFGLAPPLAVVAAPAAVQIQGFAFRPPSASVFVGEAVTWTNFDSAPHSAFAAGAFDSGVMSQGESRRVVFNTAGTFPYVCGVHGGGMSGSVTVLAATPAPTAAPAPPATPPPTLPPPTAPPTTATNAPAAPPPPPPTVVPPSGPPAPAAATPERTAAPSPTLPPTDAPTLIPLAQASPSPRGVATATPSPDVAGLDPAPLAAGAAAILALAGITLALRRRR